MGRKKKNDFSFQIDGVGFGVVPFWLSMPSFPAHWSENVVYSISTTWNLRKCPSGLALFNDSWELVKMLFFFFPLRIQFNVCTRFILLLIVFVSLTSFVYLTCLALRRAKTVKEKYPSMQICLFLYMFPAGFVLLVLIQCYSV